MKRFLAFALTLILMLSLCACGNDSTGGSGDTAGGNNTPTGSNTPTGGNTPTGSGDPTNNADPTDPSNGGSQETGYVGTWKVIPPDSNSFPPLYLVLNEDGTAGYGAKLDKLSPYFWYECEEEGVQEGTMELAREDNMGYGDKFYLTEDGTIYLETNLRVGDRSYDHITFERV